MPEIIKTILLILLGIFSFGFMIFVHELGHFIAAKWSGVRVKQFAIGMGPAIFKKQGKETLYALRLLPIGGFVSLQGEQEYEEDETEDEQFDDTRSLNNAPTYKRLIIMLAGIFMNLVLGFLLILILTTTTAVTKGALASRTIGSFYDNATTQSSGLEVGDKIITINNLHCYTPNDIVYELSRTPDGVANVEVIRDGEKITLPDVQFEVEQKTDEATGTSYNQLVLDFTVAPVKPNVFNVIHSSWNTTLSDARVVYLSLFDLITGKVSVNQISGPVGIVSAMGQAAKQGFTTYLSFLAILTINLGLMNLLPIPGLDGGQILFLLIEAITKKPLNAKFKAIASLVCVGLLFLLIIVVSFHDVGRLLR